MRSLLAAALAQSVALVACIEGRTVTLGPPMPPRPPTCDVALTRLTPEEAKARGREVGVVCLSGFHDGQPKVEMAYEDDLREELVAKACSLGGDLVTAVGTCSNSKMNGIEFGVYSTAQPTR